MEKIKISIQQVVIVVCWALSIAGLYYTMKAQIDTLQAKFNEVNNILEKHDVKLIDYRLTQLQNEMKETNDKADRIISLLDN